MPEYVYTNIPLSPEYAKNLNHDKVTEAIIDDIKKNIPRLRQFHEPTNIDEACTLAATCFQDLESYFSKDRNIPSKEVQYEQYQAQQQLYEGTLLEKSFMEFKDFKGKEPEAALPLFPEFKSNHVASVITDDTTAIKYLPYVMAAFYWNSRGMHIEQSPAYYIDVLDKDYPKEKSRTSQNRRFLKLFSLENEKLEFYGIRPENISTNLRVDDTNTKNAKIINQDLSIYQKHLSAYYLMRRQDQIGLIPLLFEHFDMSFVPLLSKSVFSDSPPIPSDFKLETVSDSNGEYFCSAIQHCFDFDDVAKIKSNLMGFLQKFFEKFLCYNSSYFLKNPKGGNYICAEWNKLMDELTKVIAKGETLDEQKPTKKDATKHKRKVHKRMTRNVLMFANEYLFMNPYVSLRDILDVQKNHDRLAFSSKHLYLATVYSICELACWRYSNLHKKVDFSASYSLFQNHTQAFHVSPCESPLYTLDEHRLNFLLHIGAPPHYTSTNSRKYIKVVGKRYCSHFSIKQIYRQIYRNYEKKMNSTNSFYRVFHCSRTGYSKKAMVSLLSLFLCIDSFDPLATFQSKDMPKPRYSIPSDNETYRYTDPLRYTYAPVFRTYHVKSDDVQQEKPT